MALALAGVDALRSTIDHRWQVQQRTASSIVLSMIGVCGTGRRQTVTTEKL